MSHQSSVWVILCALGTLAEAQAADRGFVVGAGIAASSVDSPAHAEQVPDDVFEVGIDQAPFDGNDVSPFAFVGYRLNPYVGFELEYRDFGEFEGPQFVDFFGEPVGAPTLGAEAWSASVRLRYPLPRSFEAQWHAGVSRFEYDVSGSVQLDFPFFVEIPFATPKGRNGHHWGFGFGWKFAPHWTTSLGYRKYQSSVMDFESVGLELAWAL